MKEFVVPLEVRGALVGEVRIIFDENKIPEQVREALEKYARFQALSLAGDFHALDVLPLFWDIEWGAVQAKLTLLKGISGGSR